MSFLPCALILASSLSLSSGGGIECPHWISVMGVPADTTEDFVADAISLGEETVLNGIACSFAVHPEGNPVSDKAAVYAKQFAAVKPQIKKGSAVRVGVLMQATMGHGGEPGSRTPWQLAVHSDGNVTYRFCPLDPRFLDYIAKTSRTFSDAKPDFFMVDDDTRLVWKHPGCFCPLHLAEFAKRTGRAWTREEVVAKLEAGDADVTRRWLDLKAESLARFFGTIRASYDPSIPGILCIVGSPAHLVRAREFAQILAAPGQIPALRGSGAPYHGNLLEGIVWDRSGYAAQLTRIGTDVVYLQEADTCPHTRWATSSTRLVNHMVMLALEGVKGAKVWITRNEPNEGLSRAAYRRAFRENRGLMEWAAAADFRQAGFVIPAAALVRDNSRDFDWGYCYFSRIGLPYRIGKAKTGEAVALSGRTVDALTDGELGEMLSGPVLLDGTAAIRLTARGFAADIGVEAKPWSGKTIQRQEFADGKVIRRGLLPGSADLSSLRAGAVVRSRLFNRPRLGADFDFVAPGSVRFDNPRGGRVFVVAHALTEQRPYYSRSTMYSETFRDEILTAGRELCGSIPGGVAYLGDEPMMLEAGETTADGHVFVMDNLELDADDAPKVALDGRPSAIERLQPNGTWAPVRFSETEKNVCTLETVVRTQIPAIFRWR